MIVLVGFMGAGKSTVGRLVAERVGLPFVDSDLLLEEREGRAVREIFEARGEEVFRDLEQEAIVDLLAGTVLVLALGGGACGRLATREALRSHTVVHLDVGYDEAMARVGGDVGRPMLHRPGLADLYEERRALYAQVATLVIPTDGRQADAVAADVVERLAA